MYLSQVMYPAAICNVWCLFNPNLSVASADQLQSSQELRISAASAAFDNRILTVSSEFNLELGRHQSQMQSTIVAADNKISALVDQLGDINSQMVELNSRLEAVRHIAESHSEPILGLSSNASESHMIQSDFDARLKGTHLAMETLASQVSGFIELQARNLFCQSVNGVIFHIHVLHCINAIPAG